MEIKVLGTGCTKCKKLEQLTREVVAELKLDANIEKIEDVYKIMQYGVMQTPGLVIDNRVVHTGALPKYNELKAIIKNA